MKLLRWRLHLAESFNENVCVPIRNTCGICAGQMKFSVTFVSLQQQSSVLRRWRCQHTNVFNKFDYFEQSGWFRVRRRIFSFFFVCSLNSVSSDLILLVNIIDDVYGIRDTGQYSLTKYRIAIETR